MNKECNNQIKIIAPNSNIIANTYKGDGNIYQSQNIDDKGKDFEIESFKKRNDFLESKIDILTGQISFLKEIWENRNNTQ